MIPLTSDTRLVFIGDSITDCGRTKPGNRLGDGYVRLIHDYLCARDPANSPRVFNVGISGNKVTDLAARWQRDVLDNTPDLLSIKIGINDVWHGLGGGAGVPIDAFISTYRAILQRLKDDHPACGIILCEPSVIWLDHEPNANEILAPYVQAVGDLAAEFEAAALVPLHGAFLAARRTRPDIDWTPDGVHPSSTGHMLIAREWLAATRLL
jgi:lysophospholipase L1-like esterase